MKNPRNINIYLVVVLVIFVAISLYLISFFISKIMAPQIVDDFKIKPQYKVHLDDEWSSSGGDRELKIYFTVKNEEFASCEGKYEFHGPYPGFITECTLDALKTDGRFYPVLTMSGVAEELKSVGIRGQKGKCSSLTTEYADYLVCLDDQGYIVKYSRSSGPGVYTWEVVD